MRGMLKGGGRLEAVFGIWKADMSDLGLSPNPGHNDRVIIPSNRWPIPKINSKSK